MCAVTAMLWTLDEVWSGLLVVILISNIMTEEMKHISKHAEDWLLAALKTMSLCIAGWARLWNHQYLLSTEWIPQIIM